MSPRLNIDIETYSSVDLKKCGMDKYVESEDFQILLFAYSINCGAVHLIDMTMGENIPPWLVCALSDSAYTKHAYNAAFEWRCLSKLLGELPISQWRCTQAHSLYCGYPAGLAAVGSALGLGMGKEKLNTGTALIRYFCKPCKPTKINGGRVRNYPYHNPERWQLFKEYCMRDVIAEMAVSDKLKAFPMPDFLQREWETNVCINARGVVVDLELVEAALDVGAQVKAGLLEEASIVSKLDNPNSATQLKNWLSTELNEGVPNIHKDTVERLLVRNTNNEAVQRMLEIRQELGKTSTAKYSALAATVCNDGRVRGLLRFYGANRTGRWAGRFVQVHNLPRTCIRAPEFAHKLVKGRQIEGIRLVYGNVQETLSQLIRTAFVASPGRVFIDADFSAIEARVISWLAGEQWRLGVFNTHGKIYEASASQMFGVPIAKITKGNPEYELRQKGKVAELALGYQGSVGALIEMGALKMGLPEDDLKDIVDRWRDANKRICDLWYAVQNAAIEAVSEGKSVAVGRLLISRECDYVNELDFMTILLPSGRKLYYSCPKIGENKWGKPGIVYLSGDEKRTAEETYGGKLVENCVQAIARDCLACAIERLEANGFPVVFHVHDEVIIEVDSRSANLDEVIRIMSEPVPWAPDLPLKAEGWIGSFFRKE